MEVMIRLKTPKEIEILAEGGKILSEILAAIRDKVAAGINTKELEEATRKLIKKSGGKPAFLGYKARGGRQYPAALCASINEAVVHTPANFDYEIKSGDVVSLDLGLWYKNLCTDMATTVIAENDFTELLTAVNDSVKKKEKTNLLEVTKKALKAAIGECRPGAPISAIGKKVQKIVEGAGFGVVRDLVGHGVGHEVHEEPMVPNYYDKNFDKILLKEGMVIAIEPMIAMGDVKIELAEDGFTYRTADRSIAAHFEATVAITKDGVKILTPII